MPAVKTSLWSLARSGQPVDAATLAAALEDQVAEDDLDFRTRLLIRDALDALANHWGRADVSRWIASTSRPERLRQIWDSNLGPVGFPSLVRRMTNATKPETILEFLRDLGSRLPRPARLDVGGSACLVLRASLSRHTDDIDVVDELPADVRGEHDLLDGLMRRYGLRLAHFQSHFLPDGWRERVGSLGRFGQLDVFLVDVYDVLVSKLFSAREKDLDDLRAVLPTIDKSVLTDRLRRSGQGLLGETKLAEHARRNWYVVYGEALPQ